MFIEFKGKNLFFLVFNVSFERYIVFINWLR